jgi:hypothetical protein
MTPPLAPSAGLDAELRCLEAGALAGAKADVRQDSMNALAALLLDWRVDCERQLRGLTNVQRWLERIRCGAAAEGERDLLLQEIGRLLHDAPPKNEEWLRQAEAYLSSLTR